MSEAAVQGGHVEYARVLLPLVQDTHGLRSLVLAAEVRDPAMMRLVIDELLLAPLIRFHSSTDVMLLNDFVDAIFHNFLHTIHLAAVSCHLEHVDMLLDWLVHHSHKPQKLLTIFKASLTAAPPDRCLAAATCTAQLLLFSNPEDALDYIDCSLITAVRSGNLAMVELHLNAGANVRHRANEALRLAESQGHAAMVELLKTRGAGSG